MQALSSESEVPVLGLDFPLEANLLQEYITLGDKGADEDDGLLYLLTSFACVLFKRERFPNENHQHYSNY